MSAFDPKQTFTYSGVSQNRFYSKSLLIVSLTKAWLDIFKRIRSSPYRRQYCVFSFLFIRNIDGHVPFHDNKLFSILNRMLTGPGNNWAVRSQAGNKCNQINSSSIAS